MHGSAEPARLPEHENSVGEQPHHAPDPAEVERVRDRAEVRDALRQTGVATQPEAPSRRPWGAITGVAILVLMLGALRLALATHLFGFATPTRTLLSRLIAGVFAVIALLSLSTLIRRLLVTRIADAAHRYNLERVLKLGTVLAVAFVLVSVVFVSWYTALLSVGVVSLILGFALQTPITSFIGWIYILARQPYRVGDRIRIGEVRGDVIDVSYLDTTLWEFGGELLNTEHPSGRIIKFPNSNVLNSPVYNYSWPLFPYIWNEIKFNIGYDSDLEFVSATMQSVAEEELGADMTSRVAIYRELLAHTPVDRLEVRERPSVQFRVGDNSWLEAIVRYLVIPRQGGRVKTRLITKMLQRLNAEPDRVRFPKGDMR